MKTMMDLTWSSYSKSSNAITPPFFSNNSFSMTSETTRKEADIIGYLSVWQIFEDEGGPSNAHSNHVDVGKIHKLHKRAHHPRSLGQHRQKRSVFERRHQIEKHKSNLFAHSGCCRRKESSQRRHKVLFHQAGANLCRSCSQICQSPAQFFQNGRIIASQQIPHSLHQIRRFHQPQKQRVRASEEISHRAKNWNHQRGVAISLQRRIHKHHQKSVQNTQTLSSSWTSNSTPPRFITATLSSSDPPQI